MRLFVNNVFEYKKDGKLIECERVLWMNREKDAVITISIIDKKALPVRKILSELEQEIEEGKVLKLEFEPYSQYMVPEEKLTTNELKVRDNAWLCIKDIVDLEPNIYDPHERYQMIKEVCSKTGKTKKYIYKYLRYYWMGGKMENALLPRFRKCGGKGKLKNPKKKMGRPRLTAIISPEHVGVSVNEGVRKIFDEFIRLVYLKVNRRDSVRFTYIEMLKKRFNIGMEIKNGREIPIIPPGYKVPSIAQLRYHIRTHYRRKDTLIAREGSVTFDRDFRPLLGSETRKAAGPGHIFQVDATVADVYLVSAEDPNLIIGRPVVYVVVDVWTHMVVGMYIGFEGPSWQGVMMAIENTAVNKVDFCADYGISIEQEEWPCHHLPESFYADRGEMESKNADSLSKALGIKLKNAPPYRADLKGIVEQQFRTLNVTVQPWMPGAIKKEYIKRGGPDYVLDAKLTLKDFTKMMIETILHRNNYHYMEYYPLDKAMLRDKVKPIARDLWCWGIKHDHFLKEVHPDIVRLNVLPEAKVTASREGIYFEGMYYGCGELAEQGWFVQGKSIKTLIAYDRRSVNHVYVKSHDGKSFIKCNLLEKSSRFYDLSLEEVKEIRHEEKINKALYNDTVQLQKEVELSAKLEDIKSKAEQRMEDLRDANLTKTERKTGIRQNKKETRDRLRKEQRFELNKAKQNEANRETEDRVATIDSYKPKSKIAFLLKIRSGGNEHGYESK
ncbi:DNA-binding protein [Brevibacillus panacihumi W25]|uniref:DNA-binding protein n=1 Tax=Brevibacillus panacihumi W25 TaxID=1408254 RepID=V6LYM4_9BACL|nr:Mu transposase C-terminal domain-containing protein [Brevibacillus panacihumi]EST51581.1 DNA-binding protein [Brevibacillus panacihumi W25]